ALPNEGQIIELGCGYGFSTYMIQFTGWRRKLTGVDSSAEKIEVAKNCYSKNGQVDFICADVRTFIIPFCDAIIIREENLGLKEDTLKELLGKCEGSLNGKGVLIYVG